MVRVFPLHLRQRPMDFDIAFTIRLDGKLHRLIDNPYRRPGFHLTEQRLDVRGVHPHTARADAQPTLSGALVPWMRYSPLPYARRSA
jgi:hypothetical protein